MEECLAYFRQAITAPLSVQPWSEWWPLHEEIVRKSVPREIYLQLKHRRLLGARILLHKMGEEISIEQPPQPWDVRSCFQCGERTTHISGQTGGFITCPICGLIYSYSCSPARAIIRQVAAAYTPHPCG